MKVAVIVGLLAVVGTFSNLHLSWSPDTNNRDLIQLGRWLDIEGRTTQYAYFIFTGDYPDPSSTVFLLWNSLRLAAAVVLVFGVSLDLRRGCWLNVYQHYLKVSMLLWIPAFTFCVIWATLVLAGTFCVLSHEDLDERAERRAQEAELAEARKRQDTLQRSRDGQEQETEADRVSESPPNVMMYMVTSEGHIPIISIRNSPNSSAATGNSTPSSAAIRTPSEGSLDPPSGDTVSPMQEFLARYFWEAIQLFVQRSLQRLVPETTQRFLYETFSASCRSLLTPTTSDPPTLENMRTSRSRHNSM